MRYPRILEQFLCGLLGLIFCGLTSTATADIQFLFAYKEKTHIQTDNTPPVAPAYWFFNGGVRGDTNVTAGTIVYPGSGGPVTLPGGEGDFSIDGEEYTTQAELDTNFPNGDVTVSVVDNGVTTDYGPFDITGDNYPNTPAFTNLEELRAQDGSQNYTIEWNSFSGNEANDQIVFQIYNEDLEQDVVFQVLPADSTSFVIPGGTLSPDVTYAIGIIFVKSTDGIEGIQTFVGYFSSVIAALSVSSSGDIVDMPNDAVRAAVKQELGIPTQDPVTKDILLELTSLEVTSNLPLDLRGLQFATSLTGLTLNTPELLNFAPVANLPLLEEVKLQAPQQEGLFFTHWSDGSQENPRVIEPTGAQDFTIAAQYSALPISPFAGGYTFTVTGTVALALTLPDGLDVAPGDPYQLKLNYLALEEAATGNGETSESVIYVDDILAVEVELRIKDYRWVLRSTNPGNGQASVNVTSLGGGLQIFGFAISDNDGVTESDFPFSLGNENINIQFRANTADGPLFNGPLKLPDDPNYINWDAITGGQANVISGSPNWLITLSTLPGPNQTYRFERHPTYIDRSSMLVGYPTQQPTVTPGGQNDSFIIEWQDPYIDDFQTTYEVWRGLNSDPSTATLIASNPLEPAFQDRSAQAGVEYFYFIRPIRDGRYADFSAASKATQTAPPPEDVQATQGDFSDRIRVSWTRVSGATSYSVYRAATNNVNLAELIAEGITGTEYEDTTLDSDDLFFYWVRSIAGGELSEFSNPASGYRVADSITTVRASDGLYEDRVEVTWDAFPDASSYTVYRNTINDSATAIVLVGDFTETQYDDFLGPENQGVTFFYWVRPFVDGELGSFSNSDPGYIPIQRTSPLLAWGDNDFDQTSLPDVNLDNIVAIAAGANHSLALTADGTVVAWGRNEFGQATPPNGELVDVIDIAVGYDHSLALNRDGTVVAWGRGRFGKTTVPEGLGQVIDIEAGADHSLALLADGSVVGWGNNDLGQVDIPETLNQVVQIASGGYHNLARKADGSIVAWGDNSLGQLNIPSRITAAIDIAAGWNHSLVVLEGGIVDGWGDNSRGQLDFPEDTQGGGLAGKGLIVFDPVTARIVDVSGGLFHSLALSEKGELAAWGEDKNSQTQSPGSLGAVSQIDAGDEFNLVVAESPLPKIESLIPTAIDLLSGEDTVLKVRATGGPDIAYQWLFNNQEIEGATGEALLLSNVSPDEIGSYAVNVSSGSNEVTSTPIEVDVTLTQASIASQTIRAIRTQDGTYLFSKVETNPPGLKINISPLDSALLPVTTGTHTVTVDVDQSGFASAAGEDITLILETLNDEPVRLIDTDSNRSIRYLAPEGFSSTLQISTDMKDWILLSKVDEGDGLFKEVSLPEIPEAFYRVVFEVP